jgi:uncharacterized protein
VRGLGILLLVAAIASGCASARMSDHEADDLFRSGQYDAAAEHLKKGLAKEGEDGRDSLLYYLDVGLALHSAGKYEESNQYLLKADRIAEIKDYTSLATEAGTLLVSENTKSYKGEDFEKVLINTYLAMNFALIGNVEDALVEARRVNHKLHLMVTEGKRKYKQNAFARYLSAVLYEAEGNWNDAYVDYKLTRELEPSFPGLGRDLWRLASLQRDREDMEAWEQEYSLKDEDKAEAKRAASKGKGEIIVLYENGISPIKRPNPQFRTLPRFFPRPNPVTHAKVLIDGAEKGVTAPLHSVETTAIANLDEKYGGMIAKKLAGVVAKEVVGDQVAKHTDSPLLGALVKLGLYASDQADVRSWNLLPRDLQIQRVAVDPGTHVVTLHPVGAGPLPPKTIAVKAGQKIFVNFRYMP